MDSSWICIAFFRAHCTSLLIPRASMCFSRWNTRCCSEMKWYVKMLLRKPSLKKAGGTLLSATCSARQIEWLVFTPLKLPVYGTDKQLFLHLQEPILIWIERILSCRWYQCVVCYILYYNVWIFSSTTVAFFFNKQLRAGSGIVCTSSTRLGTLTKAS